MTRLTGCFRFLSTTSNSFKSINGRKNRWFNKILANITDKRLKKKIHGIESLNLDLYNWLYGTDALEYLIPLVFIVHWQLSRLFLRSSLNRLGHGARSFCTRRLVRLPSFASLALPIVLGIGSIQYSLKSFPFIE